MNRKKVRYDVARAIATAITAQPASNMLGVRVLDTEDDQHVGPYGGVQVRVLIGFEDGTAALATIYSDERIDALLASELERRETKKARRKAARKLFKDDQ